MGGEQLGQEVDISNVKSAKDNGGVLGGLALIEFVDAAMTVDPGATSVARSGVQDALGDAAMVDAAAVAAMFQLNTRAADAAGIPVEDRTIEVRSQVGVRLGFDARLDGLAPP